MGTVRTLGYQRLRPARLAQIAEHVRASALDTSLRTNSLYDYETLNV